MLSQKPFYHFAYLLQHGWEDVWRPATDVYQTRDAVLVTLELPGCLPEDIRVTARGGALVIQAVKKNRCEACELSYQQMEIRYGYVQRSLPLPPGADLARAKARYQNGVLVIDIPLGGTLRGDVVIIRVG